MSADDHGKPSTYIHHKCRCDKCRAGNAEFQRQMRANARKRMAEAGGEIPGLRHGRTTAYVHYGCRCDECRAAYNADQRRRYRGKS